MTIQRGELCHLQRHSHDASSLESGDGINFGNRICPSDSILLADNAIGVLYWMQRLRRVYSLGNLILTVHGR